jgi:hypothetical protein
MALRPDFPRPLLTMDPATGALFYTGLNTEDAYRPLCRSHHGREGGLMAAASRSPRVAAAAVADRIRDEHGDCSPFCGVCGIIMALDQTWAQLVDYETRVMMEKATQP